MFLAQCFLFCFVLFVYFYLVIIFFIFINVLLLQIKTVQLNMYAKDGQIHTSSTDLVSLEGRISLVVNLADTWYEKNRIIGFLVSKETVVLRRWEW